MWRWLSSSSFSSSPSSFQDATRQDTEVTPMPQNQVGAAGARRRCVVYVSRRVFFVIDAMPGPAHACSFKRPW